MYNSVIECVKVSNIFIGLKKDLFGLVWKVWLYRRHSKRNQLIKITMKITTVLHYAMLAPSLDLLTPIFHECIVQILFYITIHLRRRQIRETFWPRHEVTSWQTYHCWLIYTVVQFSLIKFPTFFLIQSMFSLLVV